MKRQPCSIHLPVRGNPYICFTRTATITICSVKRRCWKTFWGKMSSGLLLKLWLQEKGLPCSAEASKSPPPTKRINSKRSVSPPRHEVLTTIASMSGTVSGGKTKVIKQLGKTGIKAAAARMALKKLQQEGAVAYSQTRRRLQNGRTWKALRVDKQKLAEPRRSRFSRRGISFVELLNQRVHWLCMRSF